MLSCVDARAAVYDDYRIGIQLDGASYGTLVGLGQRERSFDRLGVVCTGGKYHDIGIAQLLVGRVLDTVTSPNALSASTGVTVS